MPEWEVRPGNVMDVLPQLEASSVQCVVTSPPYWGLRNYGMDGQIGLEPTYTAYVESMVAVAREIRRVLRPDGTFWLNLGDCYHSGDRGRWLSRRGASGPGWVARAGGGYRDAERRSGD